jgi:2-phosphoglycerate kinase
VGKSTIATQIAVRLGIVRVVATDAVREVMRALFTSELMPTLYTSSFEADSALREPPARPSDRIVVGFREQTAAVSVGLHALVERAAIEGTSVVIEGAHVVPGFLDLGPYEQRVLAVPVVITVEDEDLHKSHFAVRAGDWATRPYERYLKGFPNIRRVQKYIKSQALSHNVPVIPNYSLDQALAALIDLVVEKATERVRATSGANAQAGEPGDAIEMEATKR